MRKIISISTYLYSQIKKEHPRATIDVIGNDSDIDMLLYNEIKNKFKSNKIAEFVHALLISNNITNDWHTNSLIQLHEKYLKIKNYRTLNKLKVRMINNPYQIQLNNKNPQNIQDISDYYREFYYDEFFNKLYNYSYNTVGKGELFLILLTDMKSSHKHDFSLNNNISIELKSSNGRLKGGKGYSNGVSVWTEYVRPYLVNKLGITDLHPNKFNFNLSNRKTISNIIVKLINRYGREEFKTFFNTICILMYINSKNWKTLGIDYNIIFKSNQFNYIEMLNQFLLFQFRYYMYITEVNYFILSNGTQYEIFQNEIDFYEKIQHINYTGFSWSDDRSFVYFLKLIVDRDSC